MNTFDYNSLAGFSCDLPEDIEKLIGEGKLENAGKLIDFWLRKDVPRILRDRLRVEKEILRVLPIEYPYTKEELFGKLSEKLPGFREEDFQALKENGRLDWIFLNGQERYFSDAVDTVLDDPAMSRKSALLTGRRYQTHPEGYEEVRSAIPEMKKYGTSAMHFVVHAGIRIKDFAWKKGRVRVWLPVPAACAQARNIRILGYTPGCRAVTAGEESPQRTIQLTEDMTENHEFFVEYEYDSRVFYHDLWKNMEEADHNTAQDSDCIECKLSDEVPAGDDRPWQREDRDPVKPEDTEEQLPHIRFTPYMRALAAELTAGLETPLEKARAIYDYITKNVKYSYVRTYFSIRNLGEYAAINQRGDCGLQALMFITLCRLSGIPARWQSGNGLRPPKRFGSHDWAMFWMEEYGWLFADCSYGGGAHDHGDEERRRFYFGNLDPWRMVAATRFQTQFDPAPEYLRRDPYDNQSGEILYEDKSLTNAEVEVNKYLVSFRPLS